MNVRTARRLADGVEIEPTQIGFQSMQGLEVASRFAGPFREPGSRLLNLNQRHANQYFFRNGLKPALSRSALVLPKFAASSGPTRIRTVSSFGPGASTAFMALLFSESTIPAAAVRLGAATCK